MQKENCFSTKLLFLLKDKNLTQKELSKILGVQEAVISRWIKNKTIPANRSIAKLVNKLDLPTNYFDNLPINHGIINNGDNNNNHINNELQDEKIKRLELEIELLKVRIERLEKCKNLK